MSSTSTPASPSKIPAAAEDPEIQHFTQQVQQGDFAAFREYLARTREGGEWQDRIFVLEQVAPKVSIDALDAACSAEPESADLLVIRCAYYAGLAQSMRGTTTSDQVSAARFQNSAACAEASMNDMAVATKLDDKDPSACTLVLRPLTIFGQTELQKKVFAQAIAMVPDLVPAHFALISALSERWGGSHVACVTFARDAVGKVGPGSDMTACLFWAQTLVRTHFEQFDRDAQAARRYASKPELNDELDTALDKWLIPTYEARRCSIPYLLKASEWYRAVGDVERLKRVAAFTGEELKLPDKWWRVPQEAKSPSKGGFLSRLLGGK